MSKVAVKLVNPSNRLKDDKGKNYFTPYDVHVVEESDRIKTAIEIGVLERVPGHPIEEPAPPAKAEKEQPAEKPANGKAPDEKKK